jgi:hypothetical protein
MTLRNMSHWGDVCNATDIQAIWATQTAVAEPAAAMAGD